MDAPRVPSVFSASVEAGRDCSHTFGLGERRLAAGPDGMSWLTPDQIGGLSRSLEPGRIRQPRSDLFCHHFEDACAICGMRPVERGTRHLLGCGRCTTSPRATERCDVGSFIVPLMGKQRPDDARILVCERNGRDIGVASCSQTREPSIGLTSRPL